MWKTSKDKFTNIYRNETKRKVAYVSLSSSQIGEFGDIFLQNKMQANYKLWISMFNEFQYKLAIEFLSNAIKANLPFALKSVFCSSVLGPHKEYEEILKLVEQTGNDISVITSNIYEYMDLSQVSEFPQLSYLSEARFIEIVKNTKKARIICIDQKICEYFEENGCIPFKGITLVEENKTSSEEYSKNLLFDYSHLFCSNTQILTLALNRLEETAATEYFAKDKIDETYPLRILLELYPNLNTIYFKLK